MSYISSTTEYMHKRYRNCEQSLVIKTFVVNINVTQIKKQISTNLYLAERGAACVW